MSRSQIAFHGGTPVFPDGPPEWPGHRPEVLESVNQVLSDGTWGHYHGSVQDSVMDALGALFQREQVVLCSSGTIAVELALRGAAVPKDSEVILSAYDFPGNFRSIEAVGAVPVLVDVVRDGWVMDPASIAGAMSDRTSAIIVSHLHGQIADLHAFRNVIRTEGHAGNVVVIEDTCQMPGGKLDSRPLGSSGDLATLSFGGSKPLTAGRGGAVLTNDARYHQRIKVFSERGNDSFPFSQLQAAALLPQLNTLESMTLRRHENALRLIEATREFPQLTTLQQHVGPHPLPAYYKLPWLLDRDLDREQFVNAIQAEGIAINTGFRGFTKRGANRCRKPVPLDNSRTAAEQTLLLHHPVLLESAETMQLLADGLFRVLQAM